MEMQYQKVIKHKLKNGDLKEYKYDAVRTGRKVGRPPGKPANTISEIVQALKGMRKEFRAEVVTFINNKKAQEQANTPENQEKAEE